MDEQKSEQKENLRKLSGLVGNIQEAIKHLGYLSALEGSPDSVYACLSATKEAFEIVRDRLVEDFPELTPENYRPLPSAVRDRIRQSYHCTL